MRILIIDHLDSFSQTLSAEFQASGASIESLPRGRDKFDLTEALTEKLHYVDALVLSPGPGHPDEYSHSCPLRFIETRWPMLPIFGVCLGLQLLLRHTGATIVQLDDRPIHGRIDPLTMGCTLPWPFSTINASTPVVSYNSLGATEETLDEARDQWNCVFTTRQPRSVNLACHRERPWTGVQFHPESFASPDGHLFIRAFLEWAGALKNGTTSVRKHRSAEI